MAAKIGRRTFTKTGTAVVAGGLLASQASRVLGANDRIRLAFIGVANRGGQLLSAFLENKDIDVVALCDVNKLTVQKANARFEGKATEYNDFRKVLERKDVDAVVIATPDHWHAIQTIWACKAGKDVYVEKPMSITIYEGRRMVEVARETGRVVQVGLHRRSSPLYAEAARMIQGGKLGKVTVSRAYQLSNMYPVGIGKAEPSAPPPELDWDLWLGPRPEQAFRTTIAPYKFRWWMPYSSQIANQGAHFFDLIRWMTADEAPIRICALGGRYAVDDDRTIPDTMEATYENPSGRLVIFGHYEANGNPAMAQPGFCELRGTEGTAYLHDTSIRIVPEKGGQFQDHKLRMEPMELKASDIKTAAEQKSGNRNLSLTAMHARNFLDCMRSRQQPNAHPEVGHRTTCYSLLGNIAWVTRATLEWDPKNEKFLNNAEANQLLHYEYRKPWKLEG